jgi:hypothetical protein
MQNNKYHQCYENGKVYGKLTDEKFYVDLFFASFAD